MSRLRIKGMLWKLFVINSSNSEHRYIFHPCWWTLSLCSIFWTQFPDNLRTADFKYFRVFQKNNTLDYVLYSIGFNGIQTKSMFLCLINFKRVMNVEQFFFVFPRISRLWSRDIICIVLEPRFCFFIKKTKTARDALTLISNAETSNSRNMHVTIVMKIMERCGVSVTKSVHVVIRRSLTPKSCFQRVFLCFSYKFHSFALYSSRFWKYIYVYNPFCYVRKNKFFLCTQYINFIKVNESQSLH